MSQVSTILDERDRRVTQELLESDNFRYVLQEEQSQTVEIMKVRAEKRRRQTHHPDKTINQPTESPPDKTIN